MGFLRTLFGGPEEKPEEKAERQREHDFDVLKYDGIRAARIGEVKYAIRCLTEADALKKDLETMMYLAEALLADRQPEEAHKVLTQAAESHPDNLAVRLGMARADEMAHDYAKMDEDCQAALLIDGRHATALYRAGQAKHALGDNINAVALLTQALAVNGTMKEALLLRAEVLAGMGSLKEAEDDIDALLQLAEGETPMPEEAVMIKATLRLRQGDTDAATLYYNKVKEENPLMQEAYLGLSMTYATAHKLDMALAVMDEALDIMPDFSEGYKERGRIKLLLNDKAGATDDLKAALETDSNHGKDLNGEFTNVEKEVADRYKRLNPFGF